MSSSPNLLSGSDALSVRQTQLEVEAIFHHASLGIAFTRNRVMTRCNLAMTEMLGYAPGELDGQVSEILFFSGEDHARFAMEVGPLLREGKPVNLIWQFRHRSNRKLTFKVSAKAVNPSPVDEGTVWLFEDITLAQQQAQLHAQTMLEFEAIMNNAPIGIIFTVDRKITRCNARFYEMFSLSPDKVLGQCGQMLFICEEDYAKLGAIAGPRLSAGLSVTYETPMLRGDGSSFWAHLVAYVVNPANTSQGTIWLISDRSEAKAQEESMRLALFENQAILDNAVVGILFLKNRVIQRCNPQAERILGFAPGQLPGQSTRDWYTSQEDYESVERELYPSIALGEQKTREMVMRRPNGQEFWCRISGKVADINDPVGGGSIWVIEDTSERHAAEEALIGATSLMQGVFNSANVSIIATHPNGIIRLINNTAERWLGYRPEDLVEKETPAIIHDIEEVIAYSAILSKEMGRPIEPGFETFVARAKEFGSDEHEWHYLRADGTRFPVHLTISTLRDHNGEITGYIGVGIDITDRKRADEAIQQAQAVLEEKVAQRTVELAESNLQLQQEIAERLQIEEAMRRMAHYDSLTGLPNRNLLHDRLNQALARARRSKNMIGLLFIDLDRFKHINDSLGHDVGDLLLAQVAQRMSYVLRDSDTLARLGGDEFVLLVGEVENSSNLSSVADKLIEVMNQPFQILSHALYTTPSIGICCYPRDGEDTETLMRNADTAMYYAKSNGRNNYRFFADNMNAEADERFRIESALRYAITKQELYLEYQPLIDSTRQRIFGVEALLRWHSESIGQVCPGKFISIAEDNGTIVQIGQWALKQACIQGKKWHQEGFDSLIVAVNLSPLQFRQKDLCATVEKILQETGFPATSLELEITESSLMNNVGEVISKLQELVSLGVRLAIDDFGTGYSSLAYLKNFPVHKLKIDQSFVRDLDKDEHSQGIVETVIALARSFKLDVLAEGVETELQHRKLKELGCRYLQGFLFSRSVSPEQIDRLLRNQE